MTTGPAAEAWDREYDLGRYAGEPPLPFVGEIVVAARDQHLVGRPGVYIGCGNGRNYLPLVEAGLDLIGLDISSIAIEQLLQRAPERANALIYGDLTTLPAGELYDLVVGIQVFQHGDRETARAHVAAAQARLGHGGLFCLRVNHPATELVYRHDITERDPDGSYTVRYVEGPKAGLPIHFFSQAELDALFAGYDSIVPLRRSITQRADAETQWSQWEAIWVKRPRTGELDGDLMFDRY